MNEPKLMLKKGHTVEPIKMPGTYGRVTRVWKDGRVTVDWETHKKTMRREHLNVVARDFLGTGITATTPAEGF